MTDEKETTEIEVSAPQLKVLSHPSRLKILLLLFEEELTLSQISSRMKITTQTVHHHIAKLVGAGLVKQTRKEIKGNLVEKYYKVRGHGVSSAKVWKELSEEEKKRYKLSTLGVLKGLINRSIRSVNSDGVRSVNVGQLLITSFPAEDDILFEVSQILDEANEKLEELSRKAQMKKKSEGRVSVVMSILQE